MNDNKKYDDILIDKFNSFNENLNGNVKRIHDINTED
jgi:hypothetical protein